MNEFPRKAKLVVILILIPLALYIWFLVLNPKLKHLTVSFLDVGQGDAILVEGPTGIQMLVDGGRDHAVLRELPRQMGPFDRSIDVVIATHPDADHIGGLSSVFERYSVEVFVEPGIPNDTNATFALVSAVDLEPGLQKIVARTGQRIDLGGGAYADILFPDRDVSTYETNTGSIVMRVVYGETSFMLSGDSPSQIEDYLVGRDGIALKTNVLKAGHHGSRNSTGDLWLSAVDPDIVVISAGKGNSYGHPHQETLDRIARSGAEVLSTLGAGAVTFESDGEQVVAK